MKVRLHPAARHDLEAAAEWYAAEGTLQPTVEGELSEHVVDQLRQDLKTKLEALEQTTVSMRTIGD